MSADDARSLAHHRRKRRYLMRSAAGLVSTSTVTAGLGFVYWAVAARLFLPTDLGESATAIAAMSLIAPVTVLGLGTLLIAELPATRTDRTTLIATAALLSGIAGSAVAFLCAIVLPAGFLGIPGIGHQFPITALFVAGAAVQGVGLLLDQALLSFLGSGMQLLRNAIQAVSKLVLLVVIALAFGGSGSLAIFASWFVANVLSIAVLGVILMRRYRVAPRRLAPSLSALRGLRFEAAKHHLLNTALFAPFFAIPIVANVILGSQRAGYLYATWSVAGFLFHLPISLALALFASGARDTRTFLLEFRFTLRTALLVCAVANVVMILIGGVILGVFGPDYAANGRAALVFMCLGGLGLVVKDHHVALARVTGRVGREALLVSMLGVGEIAGAAIGATRGGLTGLSLGWLAAIGVEVLVCGPLVWRAYRDGVDIPERSVNRQDR